MVRNTSQTPKWVQQRIYTKWAQWENNFPSGGYF